MRGRSELIVIMSEEEVQVSVGQIIRFCIITLCFLLFFWALFKSTSHKRQLQQQKNQVKQVVHLQTKVVVLAFEILNFFVSYSPRWRPGYTLLHAEATNCFSQIWNFITGNSPCYKERFPKKSVRKFIRELKKIGNTKIMIYTKLQAQTCNKLLELLGVQSQFEQKDKIFASPDSLKSAEFVDHDTGRVIIISANREDQDGEVSNHHGLILDLGKGELQEELLDKMRIFFGRLLQKGRRDLLHEEMHQMALEMNLPIYGDDSSI